LRKWFIDLFLLNRTIISLDNRTDFNNDDEAWSQIWIFFYLFCFFALVLASICWSIIISLYFYSCYTINDWWDDHIVVLHQYAFTNLLSLFYGDCLSSIICNSSNNLLLLCCCNDISGWVSWATLFVALWWARNLKSSSGRCIRNSISSWNLDLFTRFYIHVLFVCCKDYLSPGNHIGKGL
jgi:hypothetical protein